MPRPPYSTGSETRERILTVAQELFTSQGYEKTSLRDIAERLAITKAALYYYFARKEDILLELHLGMHRRAAIILDAVEAIPDGPERVAAWPQVIRSFVEQIAGDRTMMLMHQRNAGAIQALHADERNLLENEEMEARIARLFQSPAIPLTARVRMAAAIGVLTETLVGSGDAFAEVPHDELVTIVLGITDEMLGAGAPARGDRAPNAVIAHA